MKKQIIPIIFGLFLVLSISFVIAENSNEGVPSLLSQIKEVLLSILGQLQIIADKETTVNVEPNITVNPEIVIPKQECEWENLNQRQDLDLSANFGGGWNYLRGTFYIPLDTLYSEVRVLSGRAELEAIYSEHGAFFFVNEVNCGSVPSGKSNTYEFPENCINSLVSGKNILKMQVPSNSFAKIHKIWLELQIKPANC